MADKAKSKELKSDAEKNVKDAKSDNAAVEDSKEDTKNGEKEEDDESSEEEEHPGLYDKPVVIEGKRARKTTMFLSNQTTTTIVHQPKLLLFEGKGESLGDMERTNYEIGRSTGVELKPLHKLLYGREGRATEIKKNIRKFNGFAFEKDTKEYEAKQLGLDRFTNDGLKRLCEIFDLEKKGIRNDLLEKVMAFLMLPKSSGRPIPQPKAKKSEKKKRKRSKKADTEKSKKAKVKSKKTSETIESGDEGDEEEEEEEEEVEEEQEQEPPKKKKKTESSPKNSESSPKKSESSPKKSESSPKKAKETKAVKDKEKSIKEKPKAKAKKTDDKVKAPKKKEPVAVKITPLKKASPKKKTPKKEKAAPVEDDLSSDEEPLAKKTKKQPPTNSELEKIVKDLLDGADLETVTMKSVCKQVYDMFPELDLSLRKDFIKETVRQVIS